MDEPANDPVPDEDAAEVNGLAIVALFLSIVWIFGLGAIVGIALGWRALRQIRESDGAQEGRSLAIAAVVTGVVGLFSLGLLIAVGVRA